MRLCEDAWDRSIAAFRADPKAMMDRCSKRAAAPKVPSIAAPGPGACHRAGSGPRIHHGMPAQVADPLLQSYGAQHVAHFRMGLDDAQPGFAFREVSVQSAQHVGAGDIDDRRIGQVADDQPKLRGRPKLVANDLSNVCSTLK
jgi:hypothetical protein